MPPSRTSTVKNKYRAKNPSSPSKTQTTRNKVDAGSKTGKFTNSKLSGKVQKSTSKTNLKQKRRSRIYTEKELNIPALNMITPVGVQKPKGKKKGKESMMTILSIVTAERNNQVESRMMKARQLEEIREARKAESEKKQEMKAAKFTELKDSMRKKRKRVSRVEEAGLNSDAATASNLKSRKNVSFV
ncbi:60S ribosomal subunit assembly/export protein loc1 [Golovinomyces cichoracearum]|uniref:60S ribosomal subunit assembly/export protein loc1 n=1 Tax=Golovinomyces cichoracearum TaxID=62708 RepID=A0A420JAE5_9PEZI|nr:60S ribosomal subunit assembly/export protein loc1 [Golovinomyces cichoracearum]